ncbi:RNA-binding signal recognition particle subunit [Martiniozyma asiatica (nom. inval.)]|nr:RNA-binding signal recognition particle subunit [Martiniozyma asiatica]
MVHEQAVYPCYFDANRSCSEGRRVGLSHCTENPLMFTIFRACRQLSIEARMDPEKSHPQDWGNPGCVYIAVNDELNIKKNHLLPAIGDYLRNNPTTLENVKDLPGAPEYMEGEYKPQQVPKVKGFRMNTIVPLHSTLTMKNPNTAGVYIKPKEEISAKKVKKMKQKVQRIRG